MSEDARDDLHPMFVPPSLAAASSSTTEVVPFAQLPVEVNQVIVAGASVQKKRRLFRRDSDEQVERLKAEKLLPVYKREVVEGASEGGLACPGQAHQEQACAESRCPGGAGPRL